MEVYSTVSMDSFRPSLLVHTDGYPLDPQRLVHLQEGFSVVLYFHAPFVAKQEEYDAKVQATAAVCAKLAIPLVEDSIVGDAWREHVAAIEDAEPDVPGPAYVAVIHHLASYAQTEGFDFFTSVAPAASPHEAAAVASSCQMAADQYGVRYFEEGR